MSTSYSRRNLFQMAGAAAATMIGSRFTLAQQPKPKMDAGGMKGFFATHPDPFPALERRSTVAIVQGDNRREMIYESLDWFPKENLASARLVPESVLGLRLLKRGCVGQYDFGKGFIVKEFSPEAAAQLMQKLRERFGQTTPATIADEAFKATDKYLNGLCVFRKGNHVAGCADLKDGRAGVAEATRLAANIK